MGLPSGRLYIGLTVANLLTHTHRQDVRHVTAKDTAPASPATWLRPTLHVPGAPDGAFNHARNVTGLAVSQTLTI
eukprot:8806491-Pyramimonas_sp.AAC.2